MYIFIYVHQHTLRGQSNTVIDKQQNIINIKSLNIKVWGTDFHADNLFHIVITGVPK